jgi:hypothetical protein
MKEPKLPPAIEPTSALEIADIKSNINEKWDDFYTKEELARHITDGYIKGPYGQSKHYNIDEIMGYVNEVDLEKNPLPVIEEPIVEEPLIP